MIEDTQEMIQKRIFRFIFLILIIVTFSTYYVTERQLVNNLFLNVGSQIHETKKEQKVSNLHDVKKASMDRKYVVVIDAGSTGSRLHAYSFFYRNNEWELDEEKFQKVNPGLSLYGDNYIEAARSLETLIVAGRGFVPESKHNNTIIAVKATAGLRLLGPEKSEKILNEIKVMLKKTTNFRVIEEEIGILDGKYEGIYLWITVNFLEKTLSKGLKSVGVIDLGGGSLQLTFELNTNFVQKEFSNYNYVTPSRNYTLYEKSYLGYGLMEARQEIYRRILSNFLRKSDSKVSFYDSKSKAIEAHSPIEIINPCLSTNTKVDKQVVEYENNFYLLKMLPPPISNQKNCEKLTLSVLNLEKKCIYDFCSFDGVYQPNLSQYKKMTFYLLSYFYDMTIPLGFQNHFTLSSLKRFNDKVCKEVKFWRFLFSPSFFPLLESNPLWCQDVTFIYSMLKHGYKFQEDNQLKLVSSIDGKEATWSLGAALMLLNKYLLH